MLNWLIRGAQVLDGTGADAFPADVGIKDGTIAAVGRLTDADAAHVLDAQGRTLTPGFLDIHRHTDAALFRPNFGRAELAQGLTTLVGGNCGMSLAPLAGAHAPAVRAYLAPITGAFGDELCFASLADYFAAAERMPQIVNNAMLARINDKRSYANSQLLRTMCAGQPYGVPRIGEPEDLDEITPQSLYAHYRQILGTSRVEMFYMGSLAPEQVTEVLRQTLQALPRAGQVVPVGTTPAPAARPVQEKTERLDVTQGKLSLGFFTDITANDPRYPALVLAATVFGGGATSKLFTNVREQMSLCYYASASFEKFKGVLAVASGVEFSKLETAKKEILRQLEACCSGEISDYELESARGYLVSDLKIAMDSPGRLDDFYMGQILLESSATMQDLSDAIARVTKEEAAQAARALRLDTIYELQGVQA